MVKSRIKIGVPPFLNTEPLIAAIESEAVAHNFTVLRRPPSALCALMLSGGLDISLLPAADIFEQSGLRVVKGICISSFGQVGSVAVFSKKPLAGIRKIAVDAGSHSSVMMLRVILEIFNGVCPLYEKREYGEKFFSGVDAGLLIGNTGLALSESPPEGFPLRFDLGGVWTELTSLPFVYAVFAARAGIDLDSEVDALLLSKKTGMNMLPLIAKKQSPVLGLSEDLCLNYLESRIRYDLGEEEIKGFLKFGEFISQLEGNVDERGAGIDFYGQKRESDIS